MEARKIGSKKSREAMEKETFEQLSHNIKKALRFDTGGVKHTDAIKSVAEQAGFKMGDLSAETMSNYFQKKMDAVREAVVERLDVIVSRATSTKREVLP